MFCVNRIHIGYSINRKQIFRLGFENAEIGAYGLTFRKRSHFIYKATQTSDCQFIRKTTWNKIMNNTTYEDVVEQMKIQIKRRFETII